ncbi:HNH endonuclease signature motif containing protein, partial [Miniimonas arenae]|uniref:HNH endonuclease signature motif containing protein n=1 Tax=Miniimonas arenae TaxID=676201 RepID=UPI0028AE440B
IDTNRDTGAPADTNAPAPSEQDLDGVAWLIHEGPVSLRSVRRLACDADLIPVVLGTGSRVLDLGRSHRLVPAWMRTALTARDGGCLFPGCHIPATWCDAHHIIPWYQGGATSTDNAALLCGYHHHLIHTGDWTITTPRPGAIPTITPGPGITPTHRHAWTPTPEQRTNRYHRC